MQVNFRFFKRAALGAFLSLAWAGAASAGPVNLNYSTVYNGSSVITTNMGAPANALAVPGSYTYSNTYNTPTLTIPGSTNPPGYGFYDDYIFTITGATANSITTTINLGGFLQVNDLEERIYSTTGNTIPTLGTPSGTVYQSWSTPIGTVGTAAVISNLILNPGTYVLEIRGNAAGSSGGSYSGSMNLAAVPLPAALPLLLSGLGLLGGAVRGRSKA